MQTAVSCGPATTPTAPPYTDWNTFGDLVSGNSYNPSETHLSAANAGGLKLKWCADLGSAITDQPVIATNISINGTPRTVAYIGTEGGAIYALDATTGTQLWSKQLSTVSSACMDLPGGTFGITDTPAYDRTKNPNRLYVSDGKDYVHALNMSTGAEISGWPIRITSDALDNHIYSALTLNLHTGMLYVETASLCDHGTWNGRIVAINTSTASIAETFYPASPYTGAGIWGTAGVAIDLSTYNIFLATGNDDLNFAGGAPSQYAAYGDHVVMLNSLLQVLAANYPGVTIPDEDFGATPMLYQTSGCPKEISVKSKSGKFLTYYASSSGAGSVGSSALQVLQMAPATDQGQFIGSTAYLPSTNMVYVGDPVGYPATGTQTYVHGLVAFKVQSNCQLGSTPAWQRSVGPANYGGNDNDSPTVANGVVYFTDGVGNQAFAFNAATGTQLWSSGATITGPTMVAPTVDGFVYVPSWNHRLYAFGL
jgi:outer membrane protein assembly factor BamB